MSRNDRARLRRRTIGYVFQDFNLLACLTAAENVSPLPLELDGTSARAARTVAVAALDVLGLADRSGRYLTSCPVVSDSGGNRRAPSSANAGCCSPTSPAERWTRSTAKASCVSSGPRCGASPA